MTIDRLRVSLKREPAITVNRVAIGNEKLVYVICADKKLQYPWGRTPIVYVGTTKNGVSRIASSAAYRADKVLNMHGVKSFDVRVVTCRVRQGIKTWAKLERALLLSFREKFGEVPKCNVAGKKIIEQNEFEVFSKSRISEIIAALTDHGQAATREITD